MYGLGGRHRVATLGLIGALGLPLAVAGECPVTWDHRNLPGEPYGLPGYWYGSEKLAVRLPENGQWNIEDSNNRISYRQLWWALDYKPFMEKDLKVTISEYNEEEVLVEASPITNALIGNVWYMMVGTALPGLGCWEVSGEYHGETLSFVVEAVE